MGFVSDLVSGDSTDGYAELSEDDLNQPSQSGSSVVFVDVKSQDDIVNSKEALHDGLIVILDIAYIESNGLSLDAVYGELQETVNSLNGDIVHKKRNDMLVATPRDIDIKRSKL